MKIYEITKTPLLESVARHPSFDTLVQAYAQAQYSIRNTQDRGMDRIEIYYVSDGADQGYHNIHSDNYRGREEIKAMGGKLKMRVGFDKTEMVDTSPEPDDLDDEDLDDEDRDDKDEDDSVEKNFMNYATEIEDGLYVLSSKRDPGDISENDPQHLRAIQDLIKKYPVERSLRLPFNDQLPNFNNSLLNYVFYDNESKSVAVYNVNEREDGNTYEDSKNLISDRLEDILVELVRLGRKFLDGVPEADIDGMGIASQKMLGYEPNKKPQSQPQSLTKKSPDPSEKKLSKSEIKGVGRKKR